VLALWAGLAVALAAATTRVADWFVMTDELLYERLALSVADGWSPLPRVHGALIPSLNQLYPILVAPAFAQHGIQAALHDAHAVNAWVMSSACIPAYLLARRVTGRRPVAYAVASLSVCVPWIVLSSFLLTENAGYPAFLWALYALQRATASPSTRNDVLALLGLGLAVLARTQFVVLVAVLPVALLAYDRSPRRTWRRHRLLGAAYAVMAATLLALLAAGRFADAFGTYGSAIGGNLLPNDAGRAFCEHAATLALGLGILPFLAGVAWLLAGLVRPPADRERHAFACLGSLTVTAVVLEATVFDVRFGTGWVRDRYLFYVAPLVLGACALALLDRRGPRWSLVPVAAVVATGFAAGRFPVFDKLNVDAPVAALDDWLLRTAGSLGAARAITAAATVVLAVLFVQGRILLRPAAVGAAVAALALVVLPVETRYAFVRLFAVDGTSGRPISLPQGQFFDWIDRTVGPRRDVTIVPYPVIAGDYWPSVAAWWDLEFWNASVARTAGLPGQYEWTPSTFPKLELAFDGDGRANVSPTRYVAQADMETRFRIAGPVVSDTRDVSLVDAGRAWRALWVSEGLDDDGWTRPRTPATFRVFAAPGQRGAVRRSLNFGIRAPDDISSRAVEATSNVERWTEPATNGGVLAHGIDVCVPARGSATVTLRTSDWSQVYGDMRDANSFGSYREGGVLVVSVSLPDGLGGPCRPRASR
jgi:hypothetical protein